MLATNVLPITQQTILFKDSALQSLLKNAQKFYPMDRKAQIFAPTKNVGGVRKPAKVGPSSTASNAAALKKALDSIKGDVSNTLLKSFSYKSGNDVINIENPKIQSISKARKHICFLVSGKPVVIDRNETLKDMPKELGDLIENLDGDGTKSKECAD